MKSIDIYTLLLSDFIPCICNEGLSSLGGETKEENEVLWKVVYDQYVAALDKNEKNPIKELSDRIQSTFCRWKAIEASANTCRTWKVPELYDILRSYGYEVNDDDSDMAAYDKQFDRIISRSKRLLLEVQNLKSQLQTMYEAEQIKGIVITRKYFDDHLTLFSKFMGATLNEKEMTVSRYISIAELYTAHVKAAEERLSKMK